MHAHPCAQPSPTGRGSNAARGEVTAELAGAPRRLCLTLGALAEMEGALRVEGIEALAARMRALSAGDLMAVLAALLRGGGEHELAEGLSAARVDARAAAEAVAAAFAAAV
ncbi:GTA-gp10 family protein [Brevundimonas sp.]|uniref:GTA-gp10 family protein n=1 Tax=Brevundimonas sp. TaxID=1871086 RepID=UPI0039E315FE